MTIDYSEDGKSKIIMQDYILSMLNELPEDMTAGESATPAGVHLFEVNNTNPSRLDEKTAMFFHHNVAKLLFLCKRARPDIQTAVSFLCTRVKQPDIDDYKKLGRSDEIFASYSLDATHTRSELGSTCQVVGRWVVCGS
jgi:hypothetical protein